MKRVLVIAMSFIVCCFVFSGCNASESKEMSLHETPQVYILSGEDSFVLMPTITLYENGNAQLSQPNISSFALFGLGSYKVNDDELTVSYDDGANAVFTISDSGDTLTLKSVSGLGFTKVGAVYKYRSNTEYLSQYTHIDGEKLTVDILRELAKKFEDLSVQDFDKYAHTDIDPDYHVFDVEGEYTLKVIFDADGKTSCTVTQNSSGKSFPINLNGSTGYVFDEFLGLTSVPKYSPQKWVDFIGDENMPWDESIEINLSEFPGVTFTWTSEKVITGEKVLFTGMPVWNVYLADLTNDGKPEFCATVSFGSGIIIDTRIVVCDYVSEKLYQLSDRMYYDYYLSMQDGKLMVTQTEYLGEKPLVTAELQLVNGEIFRFGNVPQK